MNETGKIGDLKPLLDNPMEHTKRNRETTKRSLEELGFARSIVVDEEGTILAGNGTVAACDELGLENVIYVPVDGKTIVAVVRSGLSEEEKYRLAAYDNVAAKQAIFDAEAIDAISRKRGHSLQGIFTEKELDAFSKKRTKQENKPKDNEQESGETGYFLIIECEDEESQTTLFEEMKESGLKVLRYQGSK